MITREQWIHLADEGAFADMCASFNKALSSKVILAWFREVGDCDYQPLTETFSKLKMGDKFPTFAGFWAIYRAVNPRAASNSKYCGHCQDGWITQLVADTVTGEDDIWRSKCLNCYPLHKNAMSPHDPRIRWDIDPRTWNAKKKEQEIDIRGRIAELQGKTFGRANPANEARRQRNIERNEKRQVLARKEEHPELFEL